MATGRKNYFRHNNQARNDIKLEKVFDKFGHTGVCCYYFLLEICSEQYGNNPKKNKGVYEFSLEKIKREFRISHRKTMKFLQFFHEISLVFSQVMEDFVQIEIPNTLKYFGSYEKHGEEISPNEIKLNEIKLNKINNKENIIKEKIEIEIPKGFCHESFRQSKHSFELIESKNVSKKLQEIWLEKYPIEFIINEFEKISTWILANPQNKKKNYGAFINNWLSRGHESVKNTKSKINYNHVTKSEVVQSKILNMGNPFYE